MLIPEPSSHFLSNSVASSPTYSFTLGKASRLLELGHQVLVAGVASISSLGEDSGQAVADHLGVQAAVRVLRDRRVVQGQVHHTVVALLYNTDQLATRDQVAETVGGLETIILLDGGDLDIGQNSLLSLLGKAAELRRQRYDTAQRNDL